MREGDVKREGEKVRERNEDIGKEKEKRGNGGRSRNGVSERERDRERDRETKIERERERVSIILRNIMIFYCFKLDRNNFMKKAIFLSVKLQEKERKENLYYQFFQRYFFFVFPIFSNFSRNY